MIGYLEPHDRPETAALAEGLEVVPHLRPRTAASSSNEMDVAAVLRASRSWRSSTSSRTRTRPACATRSAGRTSRTCWTPGIDVISTVNIQHLESLNDEIAELTGVRVRETFPDRVLEEADEVVLVDLTPEALQERLRAGKVYAADRAEVALTNFFRSTTSRRCASSRCARWPRKSGKAQVGAARSAERAGGRRTRACPGDA